MSAADLQVSGKPDQVLIAAQRVRVGQLTVEQRGELAGLLEVIARAGLQATPGVRIAFGRAVSVLQAARVCCRHRHAPTAPPVAARPAVDTGVSIEDEVRRAVADHSRLDAELRAAVDEVLDAARGTTKPRLSAAVNRLAAKAGEFWPPSRRADGAR